MRFRVHTEELEFVVGRLAWFETQLAGQITAVQREVARLDGCWSGAAARAHREAQARWRADIERMHTALATMRTIAETAHANYTAAVAADAAMWSRL